MNSLIFQIIVFSAATASAFVISPVFMGDEIDKLIAEHPFDFNKVIIKFTPSEIESVGGSSSASSRVSKASKVSSEVMAGKGDSSASVGAGAASTKAGLSVKEIEDILNKINLTKFDDVSTIATVSSVFTFSQIEYQGYNGDLFYRQLVAKGLQANKDMQEINDDIASLCVLVICRGTNAKKLINRSPDNMKAQILILLETYGFYLEDNNGQNMINSNGNEVEDITQDAMILSRMTSTFPVICAELIAKGSAKSNVPGPSNLADVLKFTSGCSLIPVKEEGLFELWMDWAIENDKKINPTGPDPAKVRQYAEIAQKNSKVPENVRYDLLKRHNVDLARGYKSK